MTDYWPFFLFSIFFAFVAGSADAATTKPYTIAGSAALYSKLVNAQIEGGLGTPNLPVVYETQAKTPENHPVTRYTTKNTPVPKATLGRMTKGALGGPLGIGIAAALIAADYFIDPITGDIVVPQQPTGTSGTYWTTTTTSGYAGKGTTGQEAALDWNQTGHGGIYLFHSNPWNGGPGQKWNCTSSGCLIRGSSSLSGIQTFETSGECPANSASYDGICQPTNNPPSTVATNDEIGDVIATNDTSNPNKLVPNIIPESISSGRWRDEWPEAVSDSESINDTLENDIEGANNPTTDPLVSDSNTSAPPVLVNDNAPMSAEWPLFCDWAVVVCDFIDWVTADFEPPAPTEVPFIEIEPESFDSGIQNTAQCPADIIVDIKFGLVPISWEYPCQLAEMIRPVVIAFSWLLAIYILVRFN